MATRMTHKIHGVTYAVGAEIGWNQANGWVVEPKVKSPKPNEVKRITPKPKKQDTDSSDSTII